MKYLLFEHTGQTQEITSWVVVAMPKTAKGVIENDGEDSMGNAMTKAMYGEFELYESNAYSRQGKLFKNLSSMKKYIRACRDFEMGRNRLVYGSDEYKECSHWINDHCNAKWIKKDTELYGGLNADMYNDMAEEYPDDEGLETYPPKKVDEEL